MTEHRNASIRLISMMMNPRLFTEEDLENELDPYIKHKLDQCGPFSIKQCCSCNNTNTNANVLCEIFHAGIMGRGIRATRNIWKGTPIGCYTGVLRKNTDSYSRDHTKDWRYNYAYGLQGYYIDASQNTCMMAMVNHSVKEENVVVDYELHTSFDGTVECHIVFIAKRDIMRTEELFIDYGEDYWKYAATKGVFEYEVNSQGKKYKKNEAKRSVLRIDEDNIDDEYDVGGDDLYNDLYNDLCNDLYGDMSWPLGETSSPYFIDKSQKRITDYMIKT